MPLPVQSKTRIVAATQQLLEALGFHEDNPDTKNTPNRVASMLDKIMDGNFTSLSSQDTTSFDNSDSYRGMVQVHNAPFYSFCAHHLLPFFGTFAIGYIPEGRILGLSKLVRIFRHGCKKPTTQEAITQGAVETLGKVLHGNTRGVICHVTAIHSCMVMRGVQAAGTLTSTTAYSGRFETDLALRQQFLNQAIARGQT